MGTFEQIQRKSNPSSTRAPSTSQRQRFSRPLAPEPIPTAEQVSPPQPVSSQQSSRLRHSLATIPIFSPERENHTGLPDQLKAGIERLSGLSMHDVKVHYNSSQPARIQALAYTRGTEIYMGPGQENHLAHEAWHVAQQKQGRVRQTMQLQGVAVNDDPALEREADTIVPTLKQGKPALQMMRAGESNASLAQRTAGRTLPQPAVPSPAVIQRTKWQSNGKEWKVVSTSTDDTDEFEDPNQAEAGYPADAFEGWIYDQSTGELRRAGETIEAAEELQAFTPTILQQRIDTGEHAKLAIGPDSYQFIYKPGNITVRTNNRQNAYRLILAQILLEVKSDSHMFANLLLNAANNLPSVSSPVRELLVLTHTTEYERDPRIPRLFRDYLEKLSKSEKKTLSIDDVIKACPWMTRMTEFREQHGADPEKASLPGAGGGPKGGKPKGRKPKGRNPMEKLQLARKLSPAHQIAVAISDFGSRAKGDLKRFEATSTRGLENREKMQGHLKQVLLKETNKLYTAFTQARQKGLDLTNLAPLDNLLTKEVEKVNKLLEEKGFTLRISEKGVQTLLEIK